MIGWFARNHVAANLLMVGIAMAGLSTLLSDRIPLEVFPDFPDRTITVRVPYPGATPDETEELIVLKIEDAIEGVSGIERFFSVAGSSSGTVTIVVEDNFDPRVVVDDIKNRVDSISTFPRDAEKPVIELETGYFPVITILVAGDLSEADLTALGQQVRDEITLLPGISGAQMGGIRPYEISIEISEATLRRYGLTLASVSDAIARSALDLPAGVVRTESGEVAMKTRGRAYRGDDYAKVVVSTAEDGTRLTLGEIATIKDGFNENPLVARYNGRRCVSVTASREKEGNAVQAAQTVKDYIEEASVSLPDGVEIMYWGDRSRIVKGRIDLMVSSAVQSFLLVFIVLLLFLRLDVAFWVSIGIPVTFLGAFALMPFVGITINVSSLFGFITVLGIVVDDAIIVGESIVHQHEQGKPLQEAAISGTRMVSTPVIFGILTNIVAFMPMLLGLGDWGPMFETIAWVVIPAMVFSVVESQLCLPAHLSKRLLRKPSEFVAPVQGFANGVLQKISKVFYQPLLARAIHHRYSSIALFFGVMLLLLGYILGGRISMMPFPRVPSERVSARLVMLEGTPVEVTEAHVQRMYEIAEELREEHRGPNGISMIKHIISVVGGSRFASSRGGTVSGQPHMGEVNLETVGPEERTVELSTVELADIWRERIGTIVGAEELTFRAEIFRGGDPIDIEITGAGSRELLKVSEKIKAKLATMPGVFDISDSLDEGRKEIQFRLKPEAEQFGITVGDLASQVRQAFYGNEVQRIQRGRDEVRVFVRFPREERENLATLETMRVRGQDGTEIPLSRVARIDVDKSFSSIQRVNGHRAINIRADIKKGEVDVAVIQDELRGFIDELLVGQPGVRWSFEGEERQIREAGSATFWGSIFVLLALYTMLAIPFHSYTQPLIVLLVIPFGVVGAVVGHLIHGLPLSMMSLFGLLALTGVIINDSIVLVDFINRTRAAGSTVKEAVLKAGPRRLRPILLTSFTTFVGLMPLLFEKSTSAQFLIPMAVSLAYGILFGTMITLFLIPVCYTILADIQDGLAKGWRWLYAKPEAEVQAVGG